MHALGTVELLADRRHVDTLPPGSMVDSRMLRWDCPR